MNLALMPLIEKIPGNALLRRSAVNLAPEERRAEVVPIWRSDWRLCQAWFSLQSCQLFRCGRGAERVVERRRRRREPARTVGSHEDMVFEPNTEGAIDTDHRLD